MIVQFIVNGPDIPDALLQAHEEGRVVFFCGAGVSYPAGLPGFGGLVKDIYKLSGTTPAPYEQAALDRFQYDATLDLLERRLPGQRKALRRTLSSALKPNLRLKGATDTHAALLALARDRLGALRLITTNFDRVFEAAAKRTRQKFDVFSAPMLPIPKNSRWDGLVYLHGALPGKPDDDAALNRLVLTSGDFGLAYLTERWAARFVSELFRNYVVCFIGYSINDPVLRYMMDALAADRRLGEVTPQAVKHGLLQAEDADLTTCKAVLQQMSDAGLISLKDGLPCAGIQGPASKAFELLARHDDAKAPIAALVQKLRARQIWLWSGGAIEPHIGLRQHYPEFLRKHTYDWGFSDDTDMLVTDEHIGTFAAAIESFWRELPPELTFDEDSELDVPRDFEKAWHKDQV